MIVRVSLKTDCVHSVSNNSCDKATWAPEDVLVEEVKRQPAMRRRKQDPWPA